MCTYGCELRVHLWVDTELKVAPSASSASRSLPSSVAAHAARVRSSLTSEHIRGSDHVREEMGAGRDRDDVTEPEVR